MPHAYGYRGKTRDLFQRPFRAHGANQPLTTYLRTIKLGDYVDVVGNGAIHKGMPHKYYHGRTGIVWNVTPRAVGVLVNKQVRNRIIKKKIHVRVEHIRKSKCRDDLLKRIKANAEARKLAKEKKTALPILKRQHASPRGAHFVRGKGIQIETIGPVKFENLL